MLIISFWFLWRKSVSWPQPNVQPPNLYWSWPMAELGKLLFFYTCQQKTKQAHPSNLSHHPNESQWKIQQNAVRIWSWSWPLYQLADTMEGSNLRPHQWLFYFSTCQVNIWRQALVLWADCCSHSCDYGHKNTKMLLCDQWLVTILLNSPGYSIFNFQMQIITKETIRWFLAIMSNILWFQLLKCDNSSLLGNYKWIIFGFWILGLTKQTIRRQDHGFFKLSDVF